MEIILNEKLTESVVKVHWILQMGEINPNKIDV